MPRRRSAQPLAEREYCSGCWATAIREAGRHTIVVTGSGRYRFSLRGAGGPA